MPYRQHDLRVDAENALSDYQSGLRAAELRDQLESDVAAGPAAASRLNIRRIGIVAFLWAIAVLAMAGVATWFLDRVVAVETVGVVTAIVFMTVASRRRTSNQGAPR
jgi:hypothetical protein